jgi:hypothetical protein
MLKKISIRIFCLSVLFTLFSAVYCFGGSPYIVLSGPDSVTMEMGYTFSEPGYKAYSSTGTDITSSVVRKSGSPSSFSLTSVELIAGTYRVSYDVKDATGASAPTLYRYVTVLKDTMRPKLVVAGPDTTFVLVNKKSTGYVTLPNIIVSEDLVDGTTADTITPSNTPVNKLDTVKVMYSTSDASGNRAVVYRWVIVYDKTAPVIASRFLNDTAYLGSLYHDSVSITDNYYTTLKITRSGQFDKAFPTGIPDSLGRYTIIYTATDGSGNTSTLTQYVTVKDTFKPTLKIVGKAQDTIYLFNAYTDKGATAGDKFYAVKDLTLSTTGTFYSSFPNGKATKPGVFSIVYSATNPSGMTGSVTRSVTVLDTFKPVVHLYGKQYDTIEVLLNYKDQLVWASDTFYDASVLRGVKSGTFFGTFHNGTPVALGRYTIIYKVYNPSGDTATITRYVQVIDTIKPKITLKGRTNDSIQVMNTYSDPGVTVSDYFYATSTLNVTKSGTFYTSFPSGKATVLGFYTIVYTVTNGSGLSASVTRTVKIFDSIAPVISLTGALKDTLCQGDIYTDKGYTVSDAFYAANHVRIDTVSYYHSQQDTTPGLHYVQYRATNPSGRSSLSAKRTIYLRRLTDCEKVSLNENVSDENAIKVYPNPTTGLLNITIDFNALQTLKNIRITDLLGNIIAEANANMLQQGNFVFDLGNQPAGIYLLNISSANTTVTKQVIIAR